MIVYLFDVCRNGVGKASSFQEAIKRSERGKSMEVIDVEPLASIDPGEKGGVLPLKRKVDFDMPMEGKLVSDFIKITRTSRMLVGMRPQTPGGSRCTGGKQQVQGVKEMGKKKMVEEVYTLC